MALTSEQIDAVAGVLQAAAQDANPLQTLRQKVSGVYFSRCDAEDMSGETPFRSLPAYDLFLVHAASHCWSLVADPAHASGVVIAPRKH